MAQVRTFRTFGPYRHTPHTALVRGPKGTVTLRPKLNQLLSQFTSPAYGGEFIPVSELYEAVWDVKVAESLDEEGTLSKRLSETQRNSLDGLFAELRGELGFNDVFEVDKSAYRLNREWLRKWVGSDLPWKTGSDNLTLYEKLDCAYCASLDKREGEKREGLRRESTLVADVFYPIELLADGLQQLQRNVLEDEVRYCIRFNRSDLRTPAKFIAQLLKRLAFVGPASEPKKEGKKENKQETGAEKVERLKKLVKNVDVWIGREASLLVNTYILNAFDPIDAELIVCSVDYQKVTTHESGAQAMASADRIIGTKWRPSETLVCVGDGVPLDVAREVDQLLRDDHDIRLTKEYREILFGSERKMAGVETPRPERVRDAGD